jgi:chitin synthase
MKGKKQAVISASDEKAATSPTYSLQSLLDSLKKTRHWNVFCIRASNGIKGGKYIDALVNSQIAALNIKEYVDFIAQLDVEATAGITYEDFITKYGALVTTVGGSKAGVSAAEQVQQFISNRLWPAREIAFGSSMLFLSINRWRWIYTAMKRIEGIQSADQSSALPYEHPANDFNPVGAPFADEDTFSEYSDTPESEFNYADEFRKRKSRMGDMEAGLQNTASTVAPEKKEIIDKEEKVTAQRKAWVCCTWLLTWWVPSFCLMCGGMKRPDIRMAWREKLALCIIIFFMCMALLFLIIGLRYVICPPQNVFTQSEISGPMARPLIGGPVAYFSVYGTYIEATRLMNSHIASYGPNSGPGGLPKYIFTDLYGRDVSFFFYRQDNWNDYCPGLPSPPSDWDNMDPGLDWQNRGTNTVLQQLFSIHRNRSSSNNSPRYVDNLYQFAKGKIGWSMQTLQAISSASKVFFYILY